MKQMRFFAALAALALIFSGCAKPPTAEMNSAIDAVSRAENDADAVLYAGNSIARAKDALTRMQAEADSKRYDAAKTYAAEAVTAAEKALADGRAGAVRTRDEAAALVASLAPAIDETGRGLEAARIENLALDFDALNQEFTAVQQDADNAQAALAENRYQDALDNGRNAQSGLGDINGQLGSAVMAVTRRK